MDPKCTKLKVLLKNEEKILNLVSPDLYNLKLDIQRLFNLTPQQLKNITLYAKPVAIKGTSIEVKLEKSNDYNIFVLDQQKVADYIIIRCELKEDKDNKDNNFYLDEKKNLIEKNKPSKNNNKENENYLLKKKLEEKDQIIKKLEQTKNSYRNQLKNLLNLAYINNLKINFHVDSSLYQSINYINLNNNFIINNNSNKIDYEFIDNNSTLEVKKKEIIENKKIFDFYFKIKNKGADWPIDTLLKCIPDDSYIYFFHLKMNEGVWSYRDEYKEIIYVFPVKILFKNYSKFSKINKLSCYLVSDRYGKIGNKIGKMNLIINDY